MRADIEYPDAYDNAVKHSIHMRANAKRAKQWLADNPDGKRLIAYYRQEGEFAAQSVLGPQCIMGDDGYPDHSEACLDGRPHCTCTTAPAKVRWPTGDYGNFLWRECERGFGHWGAPSQRITQLLREALAKAEGYAVERDARRAEQKAHDSATSRHVGSVGERRDFSLTVKNVLTFASEFGNLYVNICHDADGNVIVYKGSKGWDRGAITVKATIKAHEMRDGVAQTLIARPKA